MTLWEFMQAVEGYNARTEQSMEILAWHAANIMNMWSKRRIDPKKLLRKKGGDNKYKDKESFNREMRLRRQRARESKEQ
jgi:hypothetical protein